MNGPDRKSHLTFDALVHGLASFLKTCHRLFVLAVRFVLPP